MVASGNATHLSATACGMWWDGTNTNANTDANTNTNSNTDADANSNTDANTDPNRGTNGNIPYAGRAC